MVKLNLIQFFKTGAFGSVTLGTSRAELFRRLGEPDNFAPIVTASISDLQKATTWEYGGIEFYFDTSLSNNQQHPIINIAFTPFNLSTPEKWKTLVDSWLFGNYFSPTLAELEKALISNFVPYRLSNPKGTGQLRLWPQSESAIAGVLVLSSGIEVAFGTDGAIIRVRIQHDVVAETLFSTAKNKETQPFAMAESQI